MKLLYVLPVLHALTSPQAGHGALVLDDALQGSTTGTRLGGAFVAGGWQVTGRMTPSTGTCRRSPKARPSLTCVG